MSTPSTPHSARTCVGCRKADERDALLRLVLAGDPPALLPDVGRRASGRGVSVHPRRACIESAVRSGALRRGLRTEAASPSAAELANWASVQYGRRVDGLLIAAVRSGHAAVGADAVRSVLVGGRSALLVVAGDAGDIGRELVAAAERSGTSHIAYSDKATLGRLFGREMLAVIAITDSDLAMEIQRAAGSAALLAEAS